MVAMIVGLVAIIHLSGCVGFYYYDHRPTLHVGVQTYVNDSWVNVNMAVSNPSDRWLRQLILCEKPDYPEELAFAPVEIAPWSDASVCLTMRRYSTYYCYLDRVDSERNPDAPRPRYKVRIYTH